MTATRCRFCGRPTAFVLLSGLHWYTHEPPVCVGFVQQIEITAHALARHSARLLREARQHGPN